MLKTILNPDLYHGKNKGNNFFEGWYYKFLDVSKNYSIGLIAGINLSGQKHSFIQILLGNEGKFTYITFPRNSFKSVEDNFFIQLDKNTFSLKDVNLDIEQEGFKIKGKLHINNITRWPDSIINPGSMGFYNYFSFMQCYSQVCALNCNLNGKLTINNKTIDFNGGKGYIEKNWGKDFPYSYIWVQCNDFENNEVFLTCSIGHIPFLFTSFKGFLIGIYVKGTFYKFTTINRSDITINAESNSVAIRTSNKEYELYFECKASQDAFMNLLAPREDKMLPIARESIKGITYIKLKQTKNNNVIYEGMGYNSGLEFSGDYKNL